MALSLAFVLLSVALPHVFAAPSTTACTGTISSLDDVADAVKCTTININSFTVPAGETFTLACTSGTTVNLLGDVTFAVKNWDGPLFEITGTDVTFNGNGHTFNGNGPSYWDGQGGNGGVTKPAPMLKIENSGTFTNLVVLNTPERAISVDNKSPLVISKVTVDNSAGDAANSASDGQPAGHNTDGFDVSATDLTIQDCVVKNQDDCLAINKGSNIVFTGNTCSGGHGISIGSVTSDVTISGVIISDNTITNSQQGLRIKTDASASGSSVSNVTYSGNTGSGLASFGVIIDQSYPDTLGTPGTGVTISDINFTGSKTTLSVESGGEQVAVNCGKGSCTGTWNWGDLSVSGGSAGEIVNFSGITGWSLA